MSDQDNLQPRLRDEANGLLARLAPSERESLINRCWMSHDARWFMAAAGEFGMAAANRLNQAAVRETAKVEVGRIVRALQLPPPGSIEDCMLVEELLIGLFGPDALDYEVTKADDSAYSILVKRCFASDNATRAGIAAEYECGVFARVGGWLEGLGVECEMTPPLGRCLKRLGRECLHTFRISPAPDAGPAKQPDVQMPDCPSEAGDI